MNHDKAQSSMTLCRSCDLAVRKRALPSNARAVCPRCHTALYDTPYYSINGMLALCVTALIIFFPANLLPVLEINFLGSVRDTTVYQAALSVWGQGYWVVGLAVLASAVLAPALFILSILFQILIVKLGLLSSAFWRSIYKFILKQHASVSQMTMLEIYVISFLVSAFQLSDFSDVHFGMGTLSFTLLFLIVLFMQREYSLEHMWSYVDET